MKNRLLTSVFSTFICLCIFAQSNQKTVVYLKSQPKIETLSSLVDSLTFVVQKATPKARGIIMHQTNAKKTIFAASNVDSIRVVEPNTLVITQSIADITTTSVNCKGIVSPTISSTIYARGFVWSKTTNPTYEVNLGKTTNGTQTGEYIATITGLTAGSRYYIKAYAVTGAATLYGDEISFIPGLLPTVTTNGVSTVFSTTASGSLSIVNGGSPILASGLIWGKQIDPTVESNVGMTISNSVSSSVTGGLFSLLPANDYYVRGYASNYFGVSYGNSLVFSTTLYPEVTNTITEISVNIANSNNNIATGGLPILARGVVWSNVTSPTLATNLGKTDDGIGDGAFETTLNGLTGNTTYYVRAYATISAGTTYSAQQTFKTLPIAATLTTSAATTIKATSAIVGGSISSDGGATVTERGVCWSINTTPTISDSKLQSGSGTGSFSVGLTGLVNNTTYYARAYSINSAGTSYGTTINFKTLDGIASMTTAAATSITALSATLGGSITNDGGATITERGVCWSTTLNPTITNSKATSGSGNGSFTFPVIGLSNNTTYYVRAYSTNSVGTSYGSEVSFKTLSGIATLTTTAASNITINSATLAGNITDDGGATITERGVCWSTTSSPTISDTKIANGSGLGSYTVSATGLINNTKYYARAYAISSVGASYGSEIIFSTASGLISLTTSTISSVNATSALSGGNVLSDGGAAITAYGLCWSILSNPTINLSTKTVDGSGLGSFVSTMTGLTIGATYYVRAYATNSIGTVYGNEINFSTNLPTVSTSNITEITSTTATGGGNITNIGGAAVTARGICWSTTTNPTIINSRTLDGVGSGLFSSTMTGLTGTTYYVRAYATNSIGTSYGNQVSFSIAHTLPIITTYSVVSNSSSTATSGGMIISDGGSIITSRGVCWSTTPVPTISNNTTSNGTGSGSFMSLLTGLTVSKVYYVRAYATNSLGTAYGNEINFTMTNSSLEPIGYYNSARGKSGADLKTQLCAIVGPHTERSYAQLWTDFQLTDKRSDGKVCDIYSCKTTFTFISTQCGNYSTEGDCYNREQIFPKSWFADASPMYTDLYHNYPTDGYINGKRGIAPLGEVGTVTYSSINGYSKLGTCSFPGYTGEVFEPTDSLKGDFARSYFYMVTAYDNKVAGWNAAAAGAGAIASPHLNGTQYPSFNDWTIALLMKWNNIDPVGSKERSRNQAIYNLQNNRNPFIDHPELAEYIWGSSKNQAW